MDTTPLPKNSSLPALSIHQSSSFKLDFNFLKPRKRANIFSHYNSLLTDPDSEIMFPKKPKRIQRMKERLPAAVSA